MDKLIGKDRLQGVERATFGDLLQAAISSIAQLNDKSIRQVEEFLGDRVGLSGASIQYYKTGQGHPPEDPRVVKALAEAGVLEGCLNKAWLKRFLSTANYPYPERLIETLYPSKEEKERRTGRIYHNLPGKTYEKFVMRQRPYDEVIDALTRQSAVVLIISLRGMGKTSLVYEVAHRCLNSDGTVPKFDAGVWVGAAKDDLEQVDLNFLLNEIARTLDYRSLTQLPFEAKKYEVEQLLRLQPILIIIDNIDRISDRSLVQWLLRLPPPSKALVTSGEYSRSFRSNTSVVELGRMEEQAVEEFIEQQLKLLRLDERMIEPRQLKMLVEVTDGNPKALAMSLGYIKYERQPVQQVIDDLYNGRGRLFDELFARSWELLDEDSHRLLKTMTLFSESTNRDALAYIANIDQASFKSSLDRLIELALVDILYTRSDSIRYRLHSLVRSFTRGKIDETPIFELETRKRWLTSYVQLAESVGQCWGDIHRLKLLDSEHKALFGVIRWALEHHYYNEVYRLARGARYYYFVRGLWDERLEIDLMHAAAARQESNVIEEAKALSHYLNIVSRQHNAKQIKKYRPQLENLRQAIENIPGVYFIYLQALAMCEMVDERFTEALLLWDQSLQSPDPRMVVAGQRWKARCLYKQGKVKNAQHLLQKSLQMAMNQGYTRAIALHNLDLARISLAEGRLEKAKEYLDIGKQLIPQFSSPPFSCPIDEAEMKYLYGWFYMLKNAESQAQNELSEAYDIFSRKEMRYELKETREKLATLTDR